MLTDGGAACMESESLKVLRQMYFRDMAGSDVERGDIEKEEFLSTDVVVHKRPNRNEFW